jgi:hypothetical protein
MFCNFLYWSSVARRNDLQLTLVWPETIPHLNPKECTELSQILDLSSLRCNIIKPVTEWDRRWSICSDIDILNNLDLLRSEYSILQDSKSIVAKLSKLPFYDYAIHARLGDVKEAPLLHGGSESRYFPESGYREIIERIISNNPKVTIFLSSNSPSLLDLQQLYPANLFTEKQLFSSNNSLLGSDSLIGIWILIRQLSRCTTIISPLLSSFSLLARVVSAQPLSHLTPARFLGIENLIDDMHSDYTLHAQCLFLCPRLSKTDSHWARLLLLGWRSIPFLVRVEIAAKMFVSRA